MPGSRELISDKLLNPTQATGFGPKSLPFHFHLEWAKHNFLLLRNMAHTCKGTGGLKVKEVVTITNDPVVKLSKTIRSWFSFRSVAIKHGKRPHLVKAQALFTMTFERCSGNIRVRTTGSLPVKSVSPKLPLVPLGHGADINSKHLLEDTDVMCQTWCWQLGRHTRSLSPKSLHSSVGRQTTYR